MRRCLLRQYSVTSLELPWSLVLVSLPIAPTNYQLCRVDARHDDRVRQDAAGRGCDIQLSRLGRPSAPFRAQLSLSRVPRTYAFTVAKRSLRDLAVRRMM